MVNPVNDGFPTRASIERVVTVAPILPTLLVGLVGRILQPSVTPPLQA